MNGCLKIALYIFLGLLVLGFISSLVDEVTTPDSVKLARVTQEAEHLKATQTAEAQSIATREAEPAVTGTMTPTPLLIETPDLQLTREAEEQRIALAVDATMTAISGDTVSSTPTKTQTVPQQTRTPTRRSVANVVPIATPADTPRPTATINQATATHLAALLTSQSTPAPTDTPTPVPTNTPTATATDTATPSPTATSTPTPDPAKVLFSALDEIVGENNRNVSPAYTVNVSSVGNPPVVTIRWAIGDNLTENMMKNGAKLDAAEMVEAIATSGFIFELLNLEGTFSLIDTFGNTSEEVVVWLTFTPETVNRINWDNFLWKNIYDVADHIKIHPAFED